MDPSPGSYALIACSGNFYFLFDCYAEESFDIKFYFRLRNFQRTNLLLENQVFRVTAAAAQVAITFDIRIRQIQIQILAPNLNGRLNWTFLAVVVGSSRVTYSTNKSIFSFFLAFLFVLEVFRNHVRQ